LLRKYFKSSLPLWSKIPYGAKRNREREIERGGIQVFVMRMCHPHPDPLPSEGEGTIVYKFSSFMVTAVMRACIIPLKIVNPAFIGNGIQGKMNNLMFVVLVILFGYCILYLVSAFRLFTASRTFAKLHLT